MRSRTSSGPYGVHRNTELLQFSGKTQGEQRHVVFRNGIRDVSFEPEWIQGDGWRIH